ncbi:MAG: UPF0147 family protein [Candidatus Thermoplasmatota archaeon]|nr:UPF0147 family protein [Candidatus Thermoplasmatota archaeon]
MTMEETLQEVMPALEQLIEDFTIPKNIRKVFSEVKEILLNTKNPLDVRSATANLKFEELVNDPNLPMHARTALWGVMSKLETVR